MLTQLSGLVNNYLVGVELYEISNAGVSMSNKRVMCIVNRNSILRYHYKECGGYYRFYYNNGKLQIREFYNKDGVCKERIQYSSTDKMQSRDLYGEIDMHFAWYPNGQILHKYTTKDSERHGCYRKWDTEGQLMIEEIYYKGKLISESRWVNGVHFSSNILNMEVIQWGLSGKLLTVKDSGKVYNRLSNTEIKKYGYNVAKYTRY